MQSATCSKIKKGRLWISTYDAGVNVYDKKSGHFLRINQQPGNPVGLSGNRVVSAMIELPDGRIMVCSEGAGINLISLSDISKDKISIDHLSTPANRDLMGAAKDDKGFIWVGFTDGSIFIYTPASESLEMLTDGKTFTGLIEKTGTRLTARVGQAFFQRSCPVFEVPFQDSVGHLHPDAFGNTSGGDTIINNQFNLKLYDGGSVYFDFSNLKKGSGTKEGRGYVLRTAVKNQTIKCIFLDRSGVLWVGMLGHGLYKYRIGSNRLKPTLLNFSAQRLSVLNNDIIYVQGWHTTKTLTPYGFECASPLDSIIGKVTSTNVLQSQNGDYWVWSLKEKKLLRFSSALTMLAVYPEPVGVSYTDQLQPIIEDSKNRIWVCGANGTLACIDPVSGKLSRFVINIEERVGTSAITQTTAFYEDGKGVFWMGTEHGFAKLIFTNDDAVPKVEWFKNIPGNSNSLSYNYVSSFMDDPVDADYLWISTKGGGLNRMQKSTGGFTRYTTKHGLPNDVVYGTLTDKAGNIWGSTNRGLFCMLQGKLKNHGETIIRTFSTSDGLQADEFNTNAFCKLGNGDLVFAGVNGVNIFNPEKVLAASFKPNVFITGILIGNEKITPGDKTGVLKETIEHTKFDHT